MWVDYSRFKSTSFQSFTSLQVKRQISEDPRYGAVGSSSLREELFITFLKASDSASTSVPEDTMKEQDIVEEDEHMAEIDEVEQEQRWKERKQRAVKEREDKVRVERGRLEAEIGRSRMGLNKEEGEREFKCALYVDLSESNNSVALTDVFQQKLAHGCRTRSTGTWDSHSRRGVLSDPLIECFT